MTDDDFTLQEGARDLARNLYPDDTRKRDRFAERLINTCLQAKGKDVLIIHNPGGWGETPLEQCLPWERSIVRGVSQTLEKMGYTCLFTQYFRTGKGFREKVMDLAQQANFFSDKSITLAAELRFITAHFSSIRIILIGISQGAAFSNAALQVATGLNRTYSIEIGTPSWPFPYPKRRVTTERTLTLNGNGFEKDRVAESNLWTMFTAAFMAPFYYLKYRLQGKTVKIAYCINVPGHDYNWEYPEVRRKIESFIEVSFGVRSRIGG